MSTVTKQIARGAYCDRCNQPATIWAGVTYYVYNIDGALLHERCIRDDDGR